MSCDPGADEFIQDHFGDCVYNVRDYIGFFLGLAAIAFWLVAQLPQYYRNYKTKSADALSPWFLAQWLLGDTFNLIGALLQGQQLPTTVYTAMYFVIADMFMMMQFIYYGALQRRRETVLKLQARRRHHHHTRRHHHRRDAGSSRERESLINHHPADGPPAADGTQTQQEPQQQQGQSSAWGQQQQERRRVPYQGATLILSQQAPIPCQVPAAIYSHTDASPQQHSSQQQQGQQQQECQSCSDQDADAACSCSDDSDSSNASRHSSSKGLKPLSRGISPASRLCDKAGGPSVGPASCAAAAAAGAAAAAALSAPQRVPHIRLPFRQLHWGGVRSVVAVAVLVSMGLVSLLPASTTRGLVPISLGSGLSAAAVHAPHDSSATARAMQAGQQQQGSSIHLSNPQLLDSLVGSADAGSSDVGGGSSSSNSGSSSRGWARQKRVGDDAPEHSWSFIVGTGLGYVASTLYLCSRISQIHKNYTRKSSEGLALVMFMMAVCANMCTGSSIIVRTFTWVELKEQLPWIIGSLGTISLDMVILLQSRWYSTHGGHQGAAAGAAAAAAAVQSLRQQHHQHHHHQHAHDRQGVLQPGQQQQPHMAVDIENAAAGGPASEEAATLLTSGAAVLDSMPMAPHHRGALLGRRHS